MRYAMTFDYHTHTTFSHGKGSIEDNVNAAIKKGLNAVAIADHGPGHLTYGIKRKSIPAMQREIKNLRKKYSDIQIYLGVEANIVENGTGIDLTKDEIGEFDMILAGYHYGVKEGHCVANWLSKHKPVSGKEKRQLIQTNTDMVLKAIYENPIKILTHPGDKAFFDLEEIARACEARNTWMEISTWHKHLSVDEIRSVSRFDVTFVISSDAHHPSRVGDFEEGLLRALEAELDISRIVNIEEV